MGYILEYCQECQKEHLKRTVCDEVARPVDDLVMQLRERIDLAFMTCNSKPGGPYTVEVEFRTLKEAHEFYSLLAKLPAA